MTADSSAGATPDRIEKRIFIKAPRSRVWRALATPSEFGEWFGVKVQGGFAPGAIATAQLTAEGYRHLTMSILIDRVEPESLFSFQWHPYAIDTSVDYSHEPYTLIVFTLTDAKDGTELTVTESGFERIPAHRRAEAFRMNSQGWEIQVQNIAKHVDTH